MLVAAMVASALAQPSDWYAEPVVSALHPVRQPFLHRWQNNLSVVMAGDNASPLFRNSATNMDAHWRLAANDIETPWLSEEDRLRAIEHAGLGASLALQRSFNQLIARSPEFSTVVRSLRTLAGPSLEIAQRNGDVSVRLNEGTRNQRTSMARLNEPTQRRPPPGGDFRVRPGPSLRLSSGLQVVDVVRLDDDGEEYTILRPGLSLSADADRIGPATIRLRTALIQSGQQPSLDWRAAVRVNTLPGIALLGELSGDETLPQRLQSGVEWRIPTDHNLNTRLIGSHRVEDGERRVMLMLSRPMRWHIPNDLQRWTLGQEIGTPGPAPILRKATKPGPLVLLVPPDVANDALVDQRARLMDEGS